MPHLFAKTGRHCQCCCWQAAKFESCSCDRLSVGTQPKDNCSDHGHVHRVPRLLHHRTPFASPQAIPNSAEIKRAQPSASIQVRKVAGVNRKPLQAQGLTSGEPPPNRICPQHVGVSNEGVNVITATPTLPLVGILRKCVTLSRSFGSGLVEVFFPQWFKAL